MSNIACCIFFGFLIILGLSDIIEFLTASIFSIKNTESITVTSENIEYILRTMIIKNHAVKNNKELKLNSEQIKHGEINEIYSTLCNDYPEFAFLNSITRK